MTEEEKRRWAGVCVILTGLCVAVQAQLSGDVASAREAMRATLEAGSLWTKQLEADMRRPPEPL